MVSNVAAQASAPNDWTGLATKLGLRSAALTYLTVLILLPLAVLSAQGLSEGLAAFWGYISHPLARSAVWLSITTALAMSLINIVMGTLTAYVLVKFDFAGKGLLNALLDLPIALPTLVTGVMLVLLYGPQSAFGGWLLTTWDIRIIYAPVGIVLALLFTSYPLVVRSVQPVLMALDNAQEEAAYTLGASPVYTFFRVVLPSLLSAIISGGLLSFARALGEFGSVVLVSGNIPLRTQTAAVYIFAQVEAGDGAAAGAVSLLLLAVAFSITLGVDLALRRRR
jgi:sulfate/thiosulfate transport system permease protein